MESIFTISLDFELNWGIFEKNTVFEKPSYFDNTISIIPQKLNLFEQYGIRATWATVGMLFLDDSKTWFDNIPKTIPQYQNSKVSSYKWFEEHYKKNIDRYLFAPDLIRQVMQTEGQDLGTHTYSHYYCLENGQTIEDFNNDLVQAKIAAKNFNVELSSLVFPRNQFNPAYLKTCWANGITTVRTNPDVWFWDVSSKMKKLNKVGRMVDSYLYSGRKSHFDILKLHREDNEPLKIPASRLLRPYETNKIMNKLRIKMVLNEMTAAAIDKQCYHLWWHPHNFGSNPEESLADLTTIMDHYKLLSNKYGMVSMSMADIYRAHSA